MIKKILTIEDNDDDVLMITRALRKGKVTNELQRVTNGKEALDYLQANEYKTVEFILLDLNMEIMNGFDFLRKRLEIPALKKIPVVVLTSSQRDQDINEAYNLGANAYVEKPMDPKEFMDVIIKTEEFWITICKK